MLWPVGIKFGEVEMMHRVQGGTSQPETIWLKKLKKWQKHCRRRSQRRTPEMETFRMDQSASRTSLASTVIMFLSFLQFFLSQIVIGWDVPPCTDRRGGYGVWRIHCVRYFESRQFAKMLFVDTDVPPPQVQRTSFVFMRHASIAIASITNLIRRHHDD